MHLEFFTNFKLFKDSLENKEETNFKYLRCRLDFNMYYQIREMQEMGAEDEDDLADDSQYGDEVDQNNYRGNQYGS